MNQPLWIKVHEDDNVVIAVRDEGIVKGTSINDRVTALEDIPQAHKINLVDLRKADSVVRYGATIGYANADIPAGSWIHENRLLLPDPPRLDDLDFASNVPPNPKKLDEYSFRGYRNPDGTVGTKNLLGILTSVQCVEGVMSLAIKRIEGLLPQYQKVDGVMPINHDYGCGVAINAPGAAVPIRTLRNLGTHPNFGGELLVVGLGCEKLQPDMLYSKLEPSQHVRLQDYEGLQPMVNAIVDAAETILKRLNKREREICPASDLVVGLQCGGSDAFSGITANPAIGYATDLLVAAGATVMFSEITEVRDGVHLIAPRARTPEIGAQLAEEMAWYDAYLEKGQDGREANTTPGNKQGGLSNIVEKSMGSIAKSGSTAINGVVSPGERALQKGLLFAATPASDFICGTLQLAAGMTVEVFSTGRGTPYNLKMAPVIKVASRNLLKDRWADLIDINAGRILTGETTIADVGREIFEMILAVAGGEHTTWADQWGIENALVLFNPGPVT